MGKQIKESKFRIVIKIQTAFGFHELEFEENSLDDAKIHLETAGRVGVFHAGNEVDDLESDECLMWYPPHSIQLAYIKEVK